MKRRRAAAIRLIGTKAEILGILAAFAGAGFTWRSNEYFYPRINQPDFYSYYLEDFDYVPAQY
jgi:hypothetical protein